MAKFKFLEDAEKAYDELEKRVAALEGGEQPKQAKQPKQAEPHQEPNQQI